jgi:hypothetical protein
MRVLLFIVLALFAQSASANCRLEKLQGDITMQVRGPVDRLERTLQFRALCDQEQVTRLSVNTSAGTVELRGRDNTLPARVYVDGREVVRPLEMTVNSNGRVIEVRVVVDGGGLLPRVDSYEWNMETSLEY